MSLFRPAFASLLCLALLSGCGDEESVPPAPVPVTPPAQPQVAGPVDAGVTTPVARLLGLSGEVWQEHAGRRVRATESPLWSGDVVETGADGQATVRFADGRTVEVGPEARFVITQEASGVVLEVSRGLVLSRVPETPEEGPRVALTISTPFGLTRVGSDESEVRVDVGPEESRVEVEVGAVEVVSKNGQAVQVSGGQVLSVTRERVEQRVLELAPIQVTVFAGSGRAEWRQKGTARWRGVTKESGPLQAGDSVRARKGTVLLKLEGSGSALALSEGGELVVEGIARTGSTDEARVDLLQGELALSLDPERNSRVVLPGLSLESDGAARLEVRRTGDGFTVDSRAGDVVLVRGGARESLRAGERATVTGEAASQVEVVEPAPLELGPSEAQQVFHRRLSEVALTWDAGGEVLVEVASDAAFTQRVLSGVARRGFVNVPVPTRGTLHWRVRRPEGTEVARGSAAFAPERSLKELGLLRNRVADGSQKTTIFFQDKPPAVTFTCEPDAGAASYQVRVYRPGSLDRPVAERAAPGPQVSLPEGALDEGSFLWSITPLSASGRPLRGGRMNKLELVFDNSVPTLVVSSPRDGQRAGTRVRVTGVAPVDARLFVNGQPLQLDGKHRFNTWVAPQGQPPLVLFKMTRPGSPDLYTVRALK